MRRIVWSLQVLAVVLLTLPLALLPRRLALASGERLGGLLYLIWGSRRGIAIQNLSDAVARGALTINAPPAEIVRRNFQNLGRSFVEVIKIYYGFGDAIVRDVEIRGREHLTKALEKGRGVLLVTGHCGNWELSALALGAAVGRMNVVARPINNPYLNSLVERTRQRYGNSVIYKKGAVRGILAALGRNEVVGILMDQSVAEQEGVAADFLGKKDYIMKTPALIAMKTGAAVLPGFISMTNGGHMGEIGEEIELDRSEDVEQAVFNNTVRFSACVEEYVRKNPDEWLWLHRRWKRFPGSGRDESAQDLQKR